VPFGEIGGQHPVAEELGAIRFADHEALFQKDAADRSGVSRATLTRVRHRLARVRSSRGQRSASAVLGRRFAP
jgi:predicted DNA-binding protein (UPF0251 family)